MTDFKRVAFALFLLSPQALAAPPPSHTPGGVEAQQDLRIFYHVARFSPLLELSRRSETAERLNRSVLLGSYFRAHENFRVGAFLKREWGVRHNEDWVRDPATLFWSWNKTNGRGETIYILDLSPRMDLDFLPGKNWVGELKIRYSKSDFHNHERVNLRPGLFYHWIDESADAPEVKWSAFLLYDAYLSLGSYSEKRLMESWLYAGGLYHFEPRLQFSLFGAYRRSQWNGVRATNSAVLGMGIILQLGQGR